MHWEHAVRAVYLYSGMADIARLTGDESLQEACASIGLVFFARRMSVYIPYYTWANRGENEMQVWTRLNG